MSENCISNNRESYETIIGNTTFTVVSKYIGDKPFLEFIKTAIKRDVEMAINANSRKRLD
ncbi:MAG: hypothetical protein FWH07_02975 [Oscillospiraceae bacterium]|nr:hypothetical protein [Oscillospiraceae bacterium]